MITSVDPTFDWIDITVDSKEADAILRALSLGKDRIPENRRAVVEELRAALLAFLFPAA